MVIFVFGLTKEMEGNDQEPWFIHSDSMIPKVVVLRLLRMTITAREYDVYSTGRALGTTETFVFEEITLCEEYFCSLFLLRINMCTT